MNKIKDIAAVTGIVLIIGLFVAIYVAALNGLKEDAEQAVLSSGNTNVSIGSRSFFACGKDDSVGWYFTATNAQDKSISGTVCCGFWKGCTVRF